MSQPAPSLPPSRNPAIDAYRGLVMLLMLAEVLDFPTVAGSYPHSLLWRILAFNQTHVAWTGMSLHDTIQPSFTFLVGVALPFSLRSRTARGETFRSSLLHAVRRSLTLIALGVLIRVFLIRPNGYFTFIDTLAQIGLGYTFAFLLTHARPRWQWTAVAAILFGWWLLWALYPLAPAGFDFAAAGVPQDWAPHNLHGLAAHWNRGWNLGASFDRWFYGHLPLKSLIRIEPGGYVTLNFIPTLATMLFGVIAGRWLLTLPEPRALRRFSLTGLALLVIGSTLHLAGLCPIVKRLWTPSWTLFSAGICLLALAAFGYAARLAFARRAFFPLLVVGMNSIAVYLLSWVLRAFVVDNVYALLRRIPALAATPLEPTIAGIGIVLVEWLLLYALYRRRIFLRI